jgi:putative hemolysin
VVYTLRIASDVAVRPMLLLGLSLEIEDEQFNAVGHIYLRVGMASLCSQYCEERGKIAEHSAMTAAKMTSMATFSFMSFCAWCDVM